MSGSTVAAIGALVDTHRDLVPVLDEHLQDNEGQVLPHLVMADIIRWLVAHGASHPAECLSILDWLGVEYERGPDDVRDLIAVSGIQIIPDPGQPGSELRDLLGQGLRQVDPWLA